MKKIIIKNLILLSGIIIIAFFSCTKNETYDLNRPDTPEALTVSKGDTSVFLTWNTIEDADHYLVVRGLEKIADSIFEPSFVDNFAPDTLTEYKVYSVNNDGWRSYRYASGQGFSAVPEGILPRPPVVIASDGDNVENCTLTFEGGRFATAFNIYRDGELIAENHEGTTYEDFGASGEPHEYKVYSVNYNGISNDFSTDTGYKKYLFLDTYEDFDTGYLFSTWLRRDPNKYIGYPPGGSPKPAVTEDEAYEGAKSLKLEHANSSHQGIGCYWGELPFEIGIYRIKFRVKKESGTYQINPSLPLRADGTIPATVVVTANGEWQEHEFTTPIIPASGTAFNVRVRNRGAGAVLPLYIDNWSLEYIKPEF